ncbi:hypothetical protein ON010_g293 [Phytophthora cinnamomi]|nr:hypothetical protein ON010_g293 [Phytophthora cinnamomi]
MDFAGLNWSSAVFALSVGNFAAAARAAPVRPGEGDGWRGGSAVNNMGKYTKKSKGIERDDDGWEPGLACQEGKGEIKIVRSTAERVRSQGVVAVARGSPSPFNVSSVVNLARSAQVKSTHIAYQCVRPRLGLGSEGLIAGGMAPLAATNEAERLEPWDTKVLIPVQKGLHSDDSRHSPATRRLIAWEKRVAWFL